MDNQFSLGPWGIEELPGGHNFSIYQLETSIHLANVGDSSDGPGHGVLSGNKILANSHLIATRIKFLITALIFIGLEIIGWTAVLIYSL